MSNNKKRSYSKNKDVKITKKNDTNEFTKFDAVINYFIGSALFLFIFVTMIMIVTSLVFIVGGRIFKFLLPIIYIISICFYFWFRKNKKENLKQIVLPIFIATLVFVMATVISGKIYDMSADGITYHKLAVGAMKNGWNPVWEDVSKFNKKQGNPFNLYKDNVNTKWVNTYAKGSEIYGAVVYSLTNNIDCGKSFNMIFVYIALFILYYILRQLKISTWKAILISIALALNPISLTQLTNYYLDGVLSICLFMIILLIMNKKLFDDKVNYMILGMAIICCCSVKFTGIAFAGVFCGIFFLYNNYRNFKENKNNFKTMLLKDTLFYVIVVSISVLVVGSSSYTKNFITHGHPLYPLYGKGHVGNMVLMEMPLSMQEDNRLVIFAKGVFCKSENSSPRYSSYRNEPDWKVPFTTSMEELKNFVSPDLRIGGFGYFFGGIFILSLIGTIIYLVKFYQKKEYDLLIKNILMIAIIFSLVLGLDGSYWARYIPYVYMIPILVIINFDSLSTKKQYNIYSLIIMCFLLLDSVLILGVQAYDTFSKNRNTNGNIYRFIEYSKDKESVKIKLDHHGAQGIQYNLDDLSIDNYILVDDENSLEAKDFGYYFKY